MLVLESGRIVLPLSYLAPERTSGQFVAMTVFSDDGGETWGELRFDAELIEPVCQASLIRYSWPGEKTQSTLLFSNPASTTSRVQLTVRLSSDEGATWPIRKVLHPGPSAYSCLTVLPDGSVGCLYEGGERTYQKIRFAQFTLDWLRSK